MEVLSCRPTPIILYDWCSPAEHWTEAVERLKLISDQLCIILAAKGVNEDLWCQAIDRDVYDVVSRKGEMGHLVATLQFAWKWSVAVVPDQRRCDNRAGRSTQTQAIFRDGDSLLPL